MTFSLPWSTSSLLAAHCDQFPPGQAFFAWQSLFHLTIARVPSLSFDGGGRVGPGEAPVSEPSLTLSPVAAVAAALDGGLLDEEFGEFEAGD